MHLSGFRAREGVKVGSLISLVDLDEWPLSEGASRLADDRLEAQAVLSSLLHSSTFAVG